MPGKGIDSRDSIARCDLYSNPYDVRMQAHPAIIRQRAESYERAKDTLASANSAWNPEIFLKLQAKELPLGKLLFIGTLGKYAFLAIVLPPYIFCYGIPKWLITEGLPKIYDLTARFVRRITDKVADVAHKAVAAVKTLGSKVTSPILLYIKTQVDRTLELFADLKNRAIYTAGYPYRLFHQKVIDPVSRFFAAAQRGLEKIGAGYLGLMERLEEAGKSVKRFFVYLPNNLAEGVNKIYQRLESKWNELTAPYLPYWEAVKNTMLKGNRRLEQGIENLIGRLYRAPREKLKEYFHSAKTWSHEVKEAWTRPLNQWADPKLEALKRQFAAAKDKISKILDKGKEKIRQRAKEIWGAVSDKTDQAAKLLGNGAMAASELILQMIPQPVINFFAPLANLVRTAVSLRKSERVLPVWMKKVKERIDSGLQRAFQWLKRREAQIKRAVKKIVAILGKVPMRIFSLLRQAFAFLMIALKGALLIFLLMFAWGAALLRLGMMLVRSTTRQMLFPNKIQG